MIATNTASLADIVAGWKRSGETVAVVPTMGALHDGHLSLVRLAGRSADRTIATIFVNPIQFNNPADLELYPRDADGDARLLEREGADLLFAPDADEMYPDNYSTTVSVSGISEGLCGAFRPGHFDGVATVVAKLLLQTRADLAVFGEKDYQQLHVVRRMASDLNIPARIVGHPTVREADGLAMSSRNLRLRPDQRKIASKLVEELSRAASEIASGAHVADALARARREIVAGGFSSVEYMEMRAEADLQPLKELTQPARLLAAAYLGDVRLIDNVPVSLPENPAQ